MPFYWWAFAVSSFAAALVFAGAAARMGAGLSDLELPRWVDPAMTVAGWLCGIFLFAGCFLVLFS